MAVYTYSFIQDRYGGVTLCQHYIHGHIDDVYLQGDDATQFLNDMDTLAMIDDTKQNVKRDELKQHIISQYF